MACNTDEKFENIISGYRAGLDTLGSGKLLSAALWSSGAWGQAPWTGLGIGSPQTGLSINMLKATGCALDFIHVMSYDAGPNFPYRDAYQAYRSFYPGRILLGMEVAPEAFGGNVLTIDTVYDLGNTVKELGGAGLFLFSFTKRSEGGATANEISQAVCNQFRLGDCTGTIPPSKVQ
ncbi:hypothetical protein ACKKBF_B40175 [Auxenochlorella protothecoides x Auxenochlorella symbiontica]